MNRLIFSPQRMMVSNGNVTGLVDRLVEHLSAAMTLEPGDVIRGTAQ